MLRAMSFILSMSCWGAINYVHRDSHRGKQTCSRLIHTSTVVTWNADGKLMITISNIKGFATLTSRTPDVTCFNPSWGWFADELMLMESTRVNSYWRYTTEVSLELLYV